MVGRSCWKWAINQKITIRSSVGLFTVELSDGIAAKERAEIANMFKHMYICTKLKQEKVL